MTIDVTYAGDPSLHWTSKIPALLATCTEESASHVHLRLETTWKGKARIDAFTVARYTGFPSQGIYLRIPSGKRVLRDSRRTVWPNTIWFGASC